jgi:hypothetical protein
MGCLIGAQMQYERSKALELLYRALERVDAALNSCREGLLMVEEAQVVVAQVDSEVRGFFPKGSRPHRLYERDRHTYWWPGGQKYLEPGKCSHLEAFAKRLSVLVDDVEGDVPQPSSFGRRPAEPTGWEKVDRALGKALAQLGTATSEEDYQGIGLVCREGLISLAQEVYDPRRHRLEGDPNPSGTDAKRMLEGFIAAELAGGSNEAFRAHVRSALKLANDLQHRRTADHMAASLCIEATTSVVNSIAIVAGTRVEPAKPGDAPRYVNVPPGYEKRIAQLRHQITRGTTPRGKPE